MKKGICKCEILRMLICIARVQDVGIVLRPLTIGAVLSVIWVCLANRFFAKSSSHAVILIYRIFHLGASKAYGGVFRLPRVLLVNDLMVAFMS